MKLVMTLRTRDQADIVDAVLSFHLNAGVDFVIATDHRSEDGTVETLESYAEEGVLRLIRETGEEVRGSEWRTRMARMAAAEYEADWTFSCDGDEFWWPRGGSLKDVLDAVPGRYGIVRCPVSEFVARPDDGSSFSERMTVRLSTRAPMNNPTGARPAVMKVVHRADPAAVVNRGSHGVYETSLRALRGWYPIEVLHFPVRSLDQYERKLVAWGRALGDRASGRGYEAHRRGRLSDHFVASTIDDHVLMRGLEQGSLAVDTRLRDVLRALRLPAVPEGHSRERGFWLPSGGDSLSFPRPGVEEDAAYAAELAMMEEADLVRLRRSADLIGARLASLERPKFTSAFARRRSRPT